MLKQNKIIMKKFILITGMIGAFVMFSTSIFAQDTDSDTQELTMGIPEVLLIDAVDGSGSDGAISLELTTDIAGTAITGGTGTSYAQVSSIVIEGQTRNISASVTGVPTGTELFVATDVPVNGNQAGTVGVGTTSQELTATAVDVVTGIGSMYTGVAGGDGYILNYIWDAGAAGNYGSIYATGGATAIVTMTISAGQ